MKRIALLLAFTLLSPPGTGLRGSSLEIQTLRGVAVRESPVRAGVEERLQWTPQSPWIPRDKVRDEMVAWRPTAPPATIKGVQRAFRRAGITWAKYLSVKQLFEANETATQIGKFAGMPDSFDGQDETLLQDDLIIAGRNRDLLRRFGVVIMAGGEGSRLIQKLIERGLLPQDAFEKFTKPTLPVMPISGKSPLQMQLETLAAIGQKRTLEIPVVVVVNPDTELLVKKLLDENGNFGLKQLRLVVQDVSPTLDGEGRVILRDDGVPAMNPDGTGGVLRAIAKHGVFDWFRSPERLGENGRLFLANGDMLVDEEFFYMVAAASKGRPILGVAYPYDPLKADRGIFVRVDRPGRGERLEIIETSHRKTIEGLQRQLEEMGRQNHKVLANSGLYVVSLNGIEDKISTLKPNARRGRDVARAEGLKGNKAEYYATDIFGEYEIKPSEVSVLAVDEWRLAAMKDPEEREQMRKYALQRGYQEALKRGITVRPGARVEFHPAFSGSVGSETILWGEETGVYFDRDRIWIQQGSEGPLQLLRSSPDLPAKSAISSKGFLRGEREFPSVGLDAAVGMELGNRNDKEKQEDSQGLIPLPDSDPPLAVLAAVADGMGGGRAADEASRMAIERLHARLSQPPVLEALQSGRAEDRIPDLLEQAFVSANRDVREAFEAKRGAPTRSFSGSTLVAALVTDRTVFIASIGDSRAYRLHQGELELLTPDDSNAWAEALTSVDPQGVPPEKFNRVVSRTIRAKNLGYLNQISQFIGMEDVPQVHRAVVPWVPGDRILLVSDGVIGPVEDEKLARTLAEEQTPSGVVHRLMELAHTGSDNKTALVLQRALAPPSQFTGLEERISLAAAASRGRLVILTPGTVEPALGLFSGVRGGEQIRWTAVFSDEAQAARVMAWAKEAGLRPAVEPVLLKETGMNLGEAVVGLQMDAWAAQQETSVIEFPHQLKELGRFLGLRGASERAWQEQVERSGLSIGA